MFTAECPSCGAKVSLRASASTTAVCAFCKSTLVRRAEALERIGVQGELLEDYSRVQIGTGGRFEGRGFSVVGRIQLRDDAGAWNEWHVLFDDGATGWLSEASGQYAVTFDCGKAPTAGAFEALVPGSPVTIKGERWSVSDRRSARCTAAEGELPFPVDSRWEARVADLRAGDRLVTLDWSDGDPPTLYVGRAVTLDALQPTLLRAVAAVEETAGALEGGLQNLACPSCGASVRFVPKLAANVTCRQCKSELSGRAEGLVVEVERADRAERPTWLALGDACERDGDRWTVIGILARRAAEDPQEWTEYLLYSPKGGFRWIVHASGRFQWVEVLNEAPAVVGERATLRGEAYTSSDAYDSITTWVAGSFNWRPKVDDRAHVVEFVRGAAGAGRRTLTEERTDTEATWSLATEADADSLSKAFGKADAPKPPLSPFVPDGGKRGVRDLAVIFSIVLAVLSLPAWLFGDDDDFFGPAIIAAIALWAPLRVLRGEDD
jgi:ribosomal protein L37AE/L43A